MSAQHCQVSNMLISPGSKFELGCCRIDHIRPRCAGASCLVCRAPPSVRISNRASSTMVCASDHSSAGASTPSAFFARYNMFTGSRAGRSRTLLANLVFHWMKPLSIHRCTKASPAAMWIKAAQDFVLTPDGGTAGRQAGRRCSSKGHHQRLFPERGTSLPTGKAFAGT